MICLPMKPVTHELITSSASSYLEAHAEDRFASTWLMRLPMTPIKDLRILRFVWRVRWFPIDYEPVASREPTRKWFRPWIKYWQDSDMAQVLKSWIAKLWFSSFRTMGPIAMEAMPG